MKSLKLITAFVLLILSYVVVAQDTSSNDILYDYELIPTGNILKVGDTTYNLVLVIDKDNLMDIDKITLRNELTKKDILVKSKDLISNSKIKIEKDKYKLEMDEWSLLYPWEVIAEKADGSKVKLKDKKHQLAVKHIVIKVKPKTRDVGFYDHEPIVEPILNSEQQDTSLNRNNL